jgi:hypothetical protein
VSGPRDVLFPPALAIAIAWGIAIAIVSYACVRALQFFLAPATNPALPVWSTHAGYLWRVWTVAYAGGIAAFIAFPLVRAHPAAAARALAPALGIAAALLALQTALFP